MLGSKKWPRNEWEWPGNQKEKSKSLRKGKTRAIVGINITIDWTEKWTQLNRIKWKTAINELPEITQMQENGSHKRKGRE